MFEPKKHTVLFQVKKRINWQERIYVMGNIPELGDMDREHAVPLNVMDEEIWSVDVKIDPFQQLPSDKVEYVYFIASFENPLEGIRPFQLNLKREFSLSAL